VQGKKTRKRETRGEIKHTRKKVERLISPERQDGTRSRSTAQGRENRDTAFTDKVKEANDHSEKK